MHVRIFFNYIEVKHALRGLFLALGAEVDVT